MRKMYQTLAAVVVTALLTLSLAGCKGGKNSYSINGTMGSTFESEWMYMRDALTNDLIDSARVEGGNFAFEGATDSLRLVYIVDNRETTGWTLFLEPGKMVVDSASSYVTGTPVNDGIKDWVSQLDEILFTGGDIDEFFRTHWSEHSNDIVAPMLLSEMSTFMDFDLVDSLMLTVPEEVRNNSYIKPFADMLESLRSMQPGQPFAEMELSDLEGNPVKLSQYAGQGSYLLIDFWASWCQPCRQAMPEVQSVVKKYPELKVLGVAVKDKTPQTLAAIQDLGITWPVVADPDALAAQTYGIQSIPAMMLIAPDGTIAARDLYADQLDSVLAQQLKAGK